MTVAELPELKPAQIPSFVITDDERRRWQTCVGITLEITGRYDWQFALELYSGDIPTDAESDEPDPKTE